MSYQSLGFIIFSAIVLILYYLLGKKAQPWVLACANLVFYIIAGPKYLPFILVTMVVTFFTARIIGVIYDKADKKLADAGDVAEKKSIRAASKKKAKRVLFIALIVAIGLLAVCKYTTFFLNNINLIFSVQVPIFKMVLPLGISFYTFMALSYVLDIYWKRYKAERNFLMYAVYLSYFPHVVQGPIDRYNEFKAQIENGVALSYKNITYGAQLALWGFFKKLVIADRLGIIVSTVLDNWTETDGFFIIFAIAIYSIQIYADFSGCIDIVSGISEMFGIKLRPNFDHPYFSKTMPEFWRRWHMSLQEWFKDYVYFPVSASSFVKKIKKFFKSKNLKRAEELFSTCFPILVVWLITGIWHGAYWRFVAWGLFHAALLIASKIFEPASAKINKLLHINTDTFGWQLWQMVRTYILCCIGRIFFRADGFRHSLLLIEKMIKDTDLFAIFGYDLTLLGLDYNNINIAIVSVLVLLIVDMMQEKMKIRDALAKQNIVFRWIIIFLAIFAVLIFGIYGPGYDASSFIYEQF